MPREYIARLVYDRNSQGMAVIRRGLHVVGGITYRPFPHRGFAEIVFFAIASHYQVNVSLFALCRVFVPAEGLRLDRGTVVT